MSALPLFGSALAFSVVAFALLYVVARRLDNYGIVDVAWALGFAPLVLLYAAVGAGTPERRALIAVLGVAWSLRLGGYLAWRVLGRLDHEDGRYRQLRLDWAADFGPKMFRFFLFQAFLLASLSAPFLLAAYDPTPHFRAYEFVALALWLGGWIVETVADAQLVAFRRDPARRGLVCDVGLWRWSRHPNYFGEWLMWAAYGLLALGAPWGWLGLYGPAAMLFFLLRLTGIRYTEEQLLRSKGDAYRAYQERTSAFLPWPPRAPSARAAQS